MVSPSASGMSGLGLRSKFIAAFVTQTIVIALIILLFEYLGVRGTIVDQTVNQGKAIASTVESTSSYYVIFGLVDDLRKIADRLATSSTIDYADFVDHEKRPIATTKGRTAPASLKAEPLGRIAVEGKLARSDDGRPVHLFIIPFLEGGPDTDPKGWFRLVMNESQVDAARNKLVGTNIAVAVVAMIAAILLAMLTTRFIVRPILTMASSVKRIAEGDFTQRTEVTSADEIGGLAETFNSMASNLERTLRKLTQSQAQLKSVVETVSTRSRTVIDRVDEQRSIIDETYQSVDRLNGGVRKITDNVEALSASSEETSSSMLEMVASMEEVSRHTDTLFSSVEDTASATHEMVSSINEVDQNVEYLTSFVTETSSSMVEMSASIAQVEGNAARSYDLGLAVADAAESGMKAVRETIEGMEQIRRSVAASNEVVSRLGERSVAIGKILNVIEDVAEQTNLLALNAAILAAQAGEYGKGFSVVAAEIRELSERTASSTKEIATLIRSVQEEVGNALRTMSSGSKLVEQGVELSHEAGRALNKILESASKASNMGKEIAGATREQAKGSETITRAVDRLQEMTRQISSATTQQAQGSEHILKAVESMREVTKYVRQAMVEQKSGSAMISGAAERMIDKIHEIFEVAANQATESEKIVATMEQVRTIAEGNRASASEMNDSIVLLNDAIRSLDEEIRKFRVR